MPSMHKLLVLATFALGAVAASDCSDDVIIKETNPSFDCDPSKVKVTVDPSLQGNLQIDGPKAFKDFIVSNTTKLLSISSSSLKTISGEFTVEDAVLLGNINMAALKSINTLNLNRLPLLSQLTFSSDGVEDASNVQITDTFLSDISGLMLSTVDTMTINNNKKLTKFDSNLVNITKTLILTNNGADMQVNLTELESATEIQVSNIKSLDTPALKQLQTGIKFDTNPNLESYEAANLTTVGTSKSGGSVSFINNAKLVNISFPILKTINGDLTILNNTKIDSINGFPQLATVYNMLLGGNFETAKLPKLSDVKGTINVKSTSNLTDVCTFFNGLKGNVVQGKVNCKGGLDESTANNKNGLNGTSGGKDGSNGANSVTFSTAALFLGLVAGAVQLL